MNTTTLALGAAGLYLLTRKPATAGTGTGTGTTGTGSTDTAGPAVTGLPFSMLQATVNTGTYAAYAAVGYPGIGTSYAGIVQLDADQIASIKVLETAYGIRSTKITIGQWGSKANPKIQGDPGSLTIKILDATASIGKTSQKKMKSGIRGFSEITIEHRTDSGITGVVNDVVDKAKDAVKDYAKDQINDFFS